MKTISGVESNTHTRVELEGDQLSRIDQLKQILSEAQAEYRIFVHSDTVASAREGVEKGFGRLAVMAPTLILFSEKGCIAAIISGDTQLSYKKIKKELQLKNVSLASPDLVQMVTKSSVGTVSLVNKQLHTIVDINITAAKVVYGGCGVPFHTLQIAVKDLIQVTKAQVFDFTEPRTKPLPLENSIQP